MKLYYLLFVLLIISCRNNDGKAVHTAGTTLNINGFTIITDTVTITQKEIIFPELKYKDNYYCQSYSKDSLGEYNLSAFYIIDNNYNIKKMIGVPEYDYFGNSNMYVSHDSIIVKSEHNTDFSSYLDEKNMKWKTIKTTDDVVFDDDDYYVTSLDFGEWGAATWFKDKKTGIEYEIAGILPPEIRKFKGAYYLISPGEINVVDDPKLLQNVGKGLYKSFLGIDKTGNFYSRKRSSKNKDVRHIFSRKITYEMEKSFHLSSSFIHNNSICYVVSDSIKTYIAKVNQQRLIPLAIIANNLQTVKQNNQYRNLYLNKTIKFYYTTDERSGLMEIKDDKILMHYFKNPHHK